MKNAANICWRCHGEPVESWVYRCLTVEPTTGNAQNDKYNQRVLLLNPPAAILGIAVEIPLDPAVSPPQRCQRHRVFRDLREGGVGVSHQVLLRALKLFGGG